MKPPTDRVLAVPGAAFAAIKALMEQAGHAVGDDRIAMTGITLAPRGGGSAVANDVTNIAVSTLLSSRTKEGRVELTMNGELTQMDLDKAREVVGMLLQAIEAAASDQILYAFLTQTVGLDNEKASMALMDFRELRQGSRGLVHPS